MLDRKDVEAITFATPDHWHAKIAIEAMRAGKDVYCEKPLTLTIDEGKLICKVVRETGRVFQVGTQQRSEYDGVFLEAVAMARSGRLGKKLHADRRRGNGALRRAVCRRSRAGRLELGLLAGPGPQGPLHRERTGYDFRWWFEYSGGEVTDWGVHHVDIAMWALGGENTGPIEVEGKGEFPLGRELMLETLLGKKPFAALPACFNVAHHLQLHDDVPQRQHDQPHQRQERLVHRRRARPSGGPPQRHPRQVRREPQEDPDQKQWLDEEVRKLYRGKRSAATWPTSSIASMTARCRSPTSSPTHSVNACHMANIAMLLGRKVRWDLKQQQFIDDAEANALVSRQQRPPYTLPV